MCLRACLPLAVCIILIYYYYYCYYYYIFFLFLLSPGYIYKLWLLVGDPMYFDNKNTQCMQFDFEYSLKVSPKLILYFLSLGAPSLILRTNYRGPALPAYGGPLGGPLHLGGPLAGPSHLAKGPLERPVHLGCMHACMLALMHVCMRLWCMYSLSRE